MLISIFVFLLGLCVGSYINAFVYRQENNVSLSGRSFCPRCKSQIHFYDNIPLLSWLYLKGRCRTCKKPISIQYPLVELITGVSFVFILKTFGYISELNRLVQNLSIDLTIVFFAMILLFISFILILNAVYDFKTSYLLSNYLYIGIFMALIFRILTLPSLRITEIFLMLLPGVLPALFFFSLSFLSKGAWMGEGDWELVLLMGILLGFPNIVIALYFAFIVGAIFGICNVFLSKLNMKSAVPFGPFLIAGTYFSLLFGEKLFNFYVRIFIGG